MNSLSWLIYFTDVCDTVSSSFGWLIALAMVVTIVLTAIRIGFFFDHGSKQPSESTIAFGKSLRNYNVIAFVALAYFITMQIIVPSKQAAVLMTASEINKTVIENLKVHADGADQMALGSSLTLLETWMNAETINLQKEIDAKTSPPQPSQH